MNQETDLLRQWIDGHSESAFAELIRRHVDLVHSVALRLVNGNGHEAEEIAQLVFFELARQSPRLMDHPVLAGWLYTTTRQRALQFIRSEVRRKSRERKAQMTPESDPAGEPNWEALQPVVEEAMHELNETDRNALLLLFFQNKSLREVGAVLGLNENSARMRVARALDKLRLSLARKGLTSSAAALSATLAGNAISAAPASVTLTLTTATFALPASSTALGLLKFMASTKLKIGALSALVAASLVTTLILHNGNQARPKPPDDDQLAQLRVERDRLAALSTNAAPNKELAELASLRAEAAAFATQIVVREKNARQLRSGAWVRMYGFADGHAEEVQSQDGNFDAFEKRVWPTPFPPRL